MLGAGAIGKIHSCYVIFEIEVIFPIKDERMQDKGRGWYLVASLASSWWVSFSLFTLVCSEVLTDTEVFL